MNTDLLIIYIRNSRDIYALTEWLQKCFPIRIHKTATKQEKEQASREHAAYIIGCVEYLSKF